MKFFNNIIAFSFPPTMDFGALEQMIEELKFAPCEPSAMSSAGFVPPVMGGDDAPLVHRYNDMILLALQTETRVVPPRAVDDRLAQMLKEVEEREGRVPGSRARKAMKEQVVSELMGKSFTVKSRVLAILDQNRHLLLVNTSSRKEAETFASHLRSAMGSFPAIPLSCKSSPIMVMTHWLASKNAPELLTLGDSCTLKGPDSAQVTIKNLDLHSEEVEGHLQSGLTVSKLALLSGDSYALELDEHLVLRKFNILAEPPEDLDDEDRYAATNASLFMLITHVRMALDQLDAALQFNYAA